MESSHCIWGYLKSLTQDLNSKLHSYVSLWITIRKSYLIINEQIQNLSELCWNVQQRKVFAAKKKKLLVLIFILFEPSFTHTPI